jgi:hypothetical protein
VVSSTTRRTGTIVRVHNDNLNAWQDYAGTDINIDVAYQFLGAIHEDYEKEHWQYRGQAAMCADGDDSKITRLRIGDGTSADRKIYSQTITDPEDPTQWESWSVLYTGDHYAVAIEPITGGGHRVYSAKADGIYVDNVLKVAATNVVRIKPVAFDQKRLYVQTVEQDTDGNRELLWWFVPDVLAGGAVLIEDCASYRWYRHDMVALKGPSTFYYRFRAMAHEAASRNAKASQILTCETANNLSNDEFNEWDTIRYLKGPSEQAGFKAIDNMYVTALSSARWPGGAYFLFYNERHFDDNGNVLSNLKNPLFWQRSVGFPYYLSAPVPVGFSIWGFAGAVQWEDYIWAAGNGRVLRRPQMETTLELTDYVIEGNYETPRDNQKSTGTMVCANAGNAVGAMLGLADTDEAGYTERRVDLAIGQKGASDEDYTWKVDDSWWISRLRKVKGEDGREQVMVSIGNFWHRLEVPFRDTIMLPGHFEWSDWQPDSPNQLFNYTNAYDEFVSYNPVGADPQYVPRLKTVISGNPDVPAGLDTITLFAGWRGENGMVRALLWADGGLVFRYQDADNFFVAQATSSGTLTLKRFQDGVVSTLASVALGAGVAFWLTVDYRWARIRIDVNFDDLVLEHTLVDPTPFSGFVGTTSREISNFEVSDWNADLRTKELLRILLSHADEHEVELEIDEETASAGQLDLLYGPQSDLDAPEKAFRQVLEASNLQTVFLED